MRAARRQIVLTATFLACAAGLSTGCVTAKKYKLAPANTPPAMPLNWTASDRSAHATVISVVIFKGPGSWKREARWDEYIVMIANRGDAPLVIESTKLMDPLGVAQFPGTDPWKLEKLTYSNWDKYGKKGVALLAGAGGLALYGYSTVAVALPIGWGGTASAGAVAALNVIPVVVAVDLVAVAMINRSNKAKVRAEFDRRRLNLPLTIPPGETVTGSFFYPMTPSPASLSVAGKAAGEPVELVFELKPLASLHVKRTR